MTAKVTAGNGHRYSVGYSGAPIHIGKDVMPCGGRMFLMWHGCGYECMECGHTEDRKELERVIANGRRTLARA